MSAPIDRRTVLAAGLAAVASWSLPSRAPAQQATSGLEILPLTDRLRVITGAGANITVLGAGSEALIVDTGMPRHTASVLEAITSVTGAAGIDVAFNTNWRAEHTGANETLKPQGTTIIAHENTRLWMGNDFDVEWEDRHHAPRPEEALPNETFYTEGTLELGGEQVEYGYLMQAHTDGDLYVRFPDSNVLVVSDVVAAEGYPIVDYVTGGWIGGLEKATQKLLELADDETRIVSATGSVLGRADLAAQLELCTAAREGVRDAYRSGHSLEEFVAAKPVAQFEAQRGSPDLFLYLVYNGAWGHVRELGGGII